MMDERKSGDVVVIVARDLKYRLEADILELLTKFENVTSLHVESVNVSRTGVMGKMHGEIWSVEVEALV
jgi:hypothetical protein